MRKRSIWRRALLSLNTLRLTDRCLLIFMFILMSQSAHTLFFHELTMQDASAIDVVIRTTAAAIFGYFISSNFQQRDPRTRDGKADIETGTAESVSDGRDTPSAKIGFAADSELGDMQRGRANSTPQRPPQNHLQIIVVTSIGLLALVLLLIARNHMLEDDAAIATLAQLRDFISGSVGFLIGHSPQTQKSA